ncbi:DUF2239 family protein [Bordetella hinzii]|uniref:PF09998 family protein n=2 Tax=Bordetella hinzii TaxID=103855 RepID=A0ABR4QUK6_9BORD|nr:DUF2239 family protein [Bordetella hinzii]KCB21511.1 PF09998 family protein [Bordetella hinzii OH87 BAL007II]KCB43712.1 PF09998 family protein [Bordetella hinzii 5132]QDJ43671.1 hypothetical protein CBR70_21530 [Bordetella hinzii]QDJ48253.1 hypothetical protein CBR71_21865 [Bordetella hinzii]QDJ57130.1 hypothetical protein CBR72_21085 [Bordetella hinzii]
MTQQFTAFDGIRRVAQGSLAEVALALHDRPAGQVLVFDDASGRQTDLDPRLLAAGPALAPASLADPAQEGAELGRGRGRPRLGVVAREVTLLPRHWEWLARQPGGASVTLRKLVEEARKRDEGASNRRERQDAAYHFLQAIAGNLPHYEEALRALYGDDRATLAGCMQDWPADVSAYALALFDGH